MSTKSLIKFVLVILLIISVCLFYFYGGKEYVSFDYLKGKIVTIENYYQESPLLVIGGFCAVYVTMTGLSIPGSIVLTLLSGAIFGTFFGTLLVSLSGTIGADFAFLISRYVLRDYIWSLFPKQSKIMDKNLAREGWLYLLSIRLVPASPFVVINLIMGLTSMKLWTYTWVTFIGMIPGNAIYVYAGRKFSELDSYKGILTFPIIISLILVGIFPYLMKGVFHKWRKHKQRINLIH